MYCSLFTEILLTLCIMAFAPFPFVQADSTDKMWIFCRDFTNKMLTFYRNYVQFCVTLCVV